MTIQLVAFDVAGTVLKDDGLVISAFKNAFEASQPDLWRVHSEAWTKFAMDTMGQSKIEVFTELLGDKEKAFQANTAFEEAYMNEVAEFGATPIPGAQELFEYLHSIGIKVGLTTGFSRSTLDTILHQLNWNELVDSSVTPGEAGRGRPHPDMLHELGRKLEVSDPSTVVVIGDTEADMQAAVTFGAQQAIGVLSGAHNQEQLSKAGATSIVHSVADLKSLI